MKLLKPRYAQTFLITSLVFIFYSATTRRDLSDISFSSDNLNHFLAFFILSLLMDRAYPAKTITFKATVLIAYGLMIECVQWQLIYRSFSGWDLAADTAGILAYWLAWVLWQTADKQVQKSQF